MNPESRRQPLLQALSTTDRRGAEVFAVRLNAALSALGWSTRLVALAAGRQERGLPLPTLGPSSLAPSTLRQLRRAAAGRVVLAHGSSTLPACAIATAGLSPFVYRNIGDPQYWAGSLTRRLRVRSLLTRARVVVALTASAADVLHRQFGVSRKRLVVIPNAVPIGRFPLVDDQRRAGARATLGIPAGDVVTYIGALSPEKNVSAAIEAVSQVSGAHLVIQGAGSERGLLERQARQIAVGKVRFLAPEVDPSLVLAASDVLVLPSHTEGMPAVLIEAAFTGIPVVATDVGGVSEIVRDGETGLVVPPGDVTALTSALRGALSNPADMGHAARAYCAGRFDMEHVVPLWDEVLQRIVAETNG